MSKKIILLDTFIKMNGCEALIKDYLKMLRELERIMAQLVDEKPDEGGYYGHAPDAIYEDEPVKYILKKFDIKLAFMLIY